MGGLGRIGRWEEKAVSSMRVPNIELPRPKTIQHTAKHHHNAMNPQYPSPTHGLRKQRNPQTQTPDLLPYMESLTRPLPNTIPIISPVPYNDLFSPFLSTCFKLRFSCLHYTLLLVFRPFSSVSRDSTSPATLSSCTSHSLSSP